MSNVLPEHVIATLRERRQRAAKHDCQRERSQYAGFGFNAETAAKLDLARAIGRARRVAQDKIMDGFMELISATSPAEAEAWLQEQLDRARGKASP